MNTWLAGVVSAVIGSVITLIIVKYFFTDKPELVYSLSSPIYTSLAETDNRENMQQLTIKNNGNEKAERIIVVASTQIRDYELKKYVSTDSVFVQKGANKFEMIYPSLPPEGEVEVLFKNVNHNIDNTQLSVRHDDGTATDVFTKSDGFDFNLILNLVLALILFGQFLFVAIAKTLGYHTINLKIADPPKEN